VMKHIFSGKLKPVVDRSFPLRDAAAAHRRLENSEQFGKVILNP
jgi:NADPH:quinone reductase-like Zn-dependent oxidoreductase